MAAHKKHISATTTTMATTTTTGPGPGPGAGLAGQVWMMAWMVGEQRQPGNSAYYRHASQFIFNGSHSPTLLKNRRKCSEERPAAEFIAR